MSVWFCDEIIDTVLAEPLADIFERVCCHRDDRARCRPAALTYGRSGLYAVHFRHVNVHENDIRMVSVV